MKMLLKFGYMTALLATLCITVPMEPAHGQAAAVAQAIKDGVKKVIKAIDLKIQRLQNKTIWLQNAQKTLENAMSKLKLEDIAGWVEKQKKLYEDYYKELWKVKAIITYYKQVRDISDKQVKLVQEYKRAWNMLRQNKHFTTDELDYMAQVYSGILQETARNIDQLLLVVNSFKTQMSDAKRLEIIHETAKQVDENYDDLTRFNQQNRMVSLQRAKAANDMDVIKKLYGIPQ